MAKLTVNNGSVIRRFGDGLRGRHFMRLKSHADRDSNFFAAGEETFEPFCGETVP
ncbi:MAG: hypothetical protein ACI4RV_09665 [Eubacteriales bacterium]